MIRGTPLAQQWNPPTIPHRLETGQKRLSQKCSVTLNLKPALWQFCFVWLDYIMIVYATFRSNLLMILKTSKKDYTKLLSTMQALRKALPCSYIPQKETKQHIFGQNPCVQGGWRHCNYSRLLSTVRLVWCLRLVRFWQLRLQSDCQRWQTQLAGREERTLRQRAPNVHLNRLA